MIKNKETQQQGTILIMALWTLGFLSIFAVAIGMHVRQKITVLSRLEKRSALQAVAESGVRKAKAVFDSRHLGRGLPVSGSHKQAWFNDPFLFRAQEIGPGSFEVGYNEFFLKKAEPERRYGLSDEERRVNINTADRNILARLIAQVSPGEKDRADELARAIIAWREYGDTDIVGFYSEDFYENLEFPYAPKKEPFENLDELRLVDGMTDALFMRLVDFITVYGEGHVNINTAPGPVLTALGLDPATVQKLLMLRRGKDGLDDTPDDYMFTLYLEHRRLILPQENNLKKDEQTLIQTLVNRGVMGVSSSCFRIESVGRLANSQETMTITCVFDGNSGRIFYWREKRTRPGTESALPWTG